MKIKESELDDLFARGVGEFIDPNGKFKEKIQNKIDGQYPKDIIIKFGVDPTRPDIHLGHAVVLRKLRKFQDLGCKVVFLIGDITALIGDPTGKSKVRPELEILEIQQNMKSYLDQVDKILLKDPKVFEWTMNSDWFVSINDVLAPENKYKDENGFLPGNHVKAKAMHWVETRRQKDNINNYTLINLLSFLRRISFNRLIERDMFQDRIKNGEPVFMHEMMYPILQGIDSNAIASVYGSCDLEVGGSDQTFNMLMGREVMEISKKEPQAVLSFKILEGTDGKEKMSKSLGNYIGITDSPEEIFGKVMSIPDASIPNYFELCTYAPVSEIEEIKKSLQSDKTNPRDLKMRLAREIVAIYHGEESSKRAETNFINVFQKKEIPIDIPEIKGLETENFSDLLVKNNILKSKSEFTRLVDERAIENLENNEFVADYHFKVSQTSIFRIGKKRFVKVVI